MTLQFSSREKWGTSPKYPCNIFHCCKKQQSSIYKQYLHSNEKVRAVWLLADSVGRTRQHWTTRPQITFLRSLCGGCHDMNDCDVMLHCWRCNSDALVFEFHENTEVRVQEAWLRTSKLSIRTSSIGTRL